ncbi:MAG: putative glycoside hydrolase [bacterium]|nr:putative glycoside hydrolase [bacterium]
MPHRFSVPLLLVALIVGGGILYGIVAPTTQLSYDRKAMTATTASSSAAGVLALPAGPPAFVVTHIAPPPVVNAAYMTSCIASGKKLRAPLVALLESTELNALVIDIKDYTGLISFETGDPRFSLNTKGCYVPNMKEFIGELHEKNVYVIGRVTVMQDATYPKLYPDAAVKRRSDGKIWKDKKGLTFVDPGAVEYWDHMIDLGTASYEIGFDEINYDYIRFPSDGDMSDIKFARTGTTTKAAMMKKFYAYLGGEMQKAGIPISADLFGMTTTNTDDLNIGQVLEDALRYFDFVAPMVYPSHYPPGFNGWKNPNNVPYEIIKFSMDRAVARANKLEEKESGWVAPKVGTTTPVVSAQGGTTGQAGTTASSSLKFIPKGIYANKLRPWIQDFDYGKVYTEQDVRAQKKAVYDAGLTSWMAWDPSNKYTLSAYDKE